MIGINEINSDQLKQLQESADSFHLLDVRSQGEMEQAMIPGGKPLPVVQIDEELSALKQDEKLVVYCRSGVRSAQVCNYLMQKGFHNVFNLSGGIIDWYNRGHSLTNLQSVQLANQMA